MATEKIAKIQSFEGLISPPFTPFQPNGEINPGIIPKYVDYLVSQGVTGVFVNGTTGEGMSLSVEERKTFAEAWVKAGKNKLELVLIQVGANSLKDVVELASHAEKIGATGIASPPQLFYKPQTHDHLIAYFKAISDAAPNLPILLYYIPSYSGVEIALGEFMPKARKAIPNFCGAKFTSVDVRLLLKCHDLPGAPFKFLSGLDEVLLPCMTCGVNAAVGASYNFMAPISLPIIEAYKKGDIKAARKHQNRVHHAIETIFKHGQEMSCFKAVMNLTSPIDCGLPRVPLLPLSAEALKNLEEDLKALKSEEWKRD